MLKFIKRVVYNKKGCIFVKDKKNNYKIISIMENVIISKIEYVELLKSRLYAMEKAKDFDSSWNYGIEELQEKIEKLENNIYTCKYITQ